MARKAYSPAVNPKGRSGSAEDHIMAAIQSPTVPRQTFVSTVLSARRFSARVAKSQGDCVMLVTEGWVISSDTGVNRRRF